MKVLANPIERRAGVAYRPDVDGLRGIAVIAVVLYHAFPAVVRSGFVGVDIFFVVSGFLISSIVLDDLASGRFSFGHFYARRIRRLFPALIAVLSFAFVPAWLYLLDSEFRQFSKHVAGASGFVSNLILWGESGYFDTEARAKPLLHLWSLGIEEQFYLAWPLVLWAAWKWRRALPIGVVALALASLTLEIRAGVADPGGSFFSPLARFWELLAGVLLALLAHGKGAEASLVRRPIADAAAAAALAAILVACFAIAPGALYPGWWALLPVSAAAVLIATGPDTWVHRRLLSAPPLVWVGLISYALYLWHWPLLSFAHVIGHEEPAVRAALVAASVVFAWVTWGWIERPIRFGRTWPRARIGALVGAMALIGLLGLMGSQGMLTSFGTRQLRDFDADRAWTYANSQRLKPVEIGSGDFPGAAKLRDDLRFHHAIMSLRWIDSGNPRKVLFVGDSHAEHLWSRVDQLIIERDGNARSAVFLTASAFLPISGVHTSQERNPQFVGLADTMAAYSLSRPEIDTVVIAAFWDRHLGEPGLKGESSWFVWVDGKQQFLKRGRPANDVAYASLGETIRTLRRAGKRVFLVLDGFSGEAKVTRTWRGFALADGSHSLRAFLRSSSYTRERLAGVAWEAGAEIVDPAPVLCPDGITCPTTFDGVHPVYMDGRHYSDRFMRTRGTFIDKAVLLE